MSAPPMRRSCRHMAGVERDLAGAAEQEALRRRRLEDQILALVRRAVAEALQAEPVGPDDRSGVGVARIDRLEPFGRRQRAVAGGDGDEQPVGDVRRVGRQRLDARIGRRERGPHEGEVDARLRAGRRCTLKRIAAGGTLNATPPMVIGSEGASGAIAARRGHSM